ncbi:conjugal transfer protein TrbI [Campylobacter sp. CNRCH_2016_3089]|uniref:TrbI/VirB10 family protein n=1 Tax=Campylobacter sp. CNRCH_2016_3089 TaxID=2911609 RepID=UPI0018536675|nr:TrbI/VirB10 family protein [Campylobacter sp. CNRCH_2016_3089]EAI7269716.1 conjugal transfer protein TrbI [Campylobacter lari]MCV3509208.1 conjugal transfer protein TrbI [Campylobacter sp. CNRCH_2016_3089]
MLEINTSPNKFLTKGNKRLSKVPLIIILGIILVFLFSMFYVALSRKQNLEKQNIQDTKKEETQTTIKDNGNINSYINELMQSPKIEKNVSSSKDDNTSSNVIIQNQPQILPQNNTAPLLIETNEADERELRLKKDMQLKALISDTKLDIKTNDNKDSSIQNNSQQIIGNNSFNNDSIIQGDLENSSNNKDLQQNQFLSQKNDNGYLKQFKQKPLSPYEIKAGWNIPAILITGVNSELPGQILAQVTENVYDTTTGKYLLIPQGTKVVGAYSSNIIYGQSRLLVAWNKLIFPNGDTLTLENMQGTSQDGYTGFEDEVDNHYFRIFGSALLLSSITAGIALSDNSSTNGEKETASDKAISQAIQQMGQVASEMIRKNMNISPTLKIRPGYKFNIFVTKDIILEPLELR